jgi:phage terminase small subunit
MPISQYENLTVKQQQFVDFYDGNATQAAEKAGYRNPRQMGSENLSKPDIVAALKTREDRERNNKIWTRKDRQRFWTRVALGKEVHKELDNDGNLIEIPPRMIDRLKASELLGKSEADFTNKLGVGGIDPEGEITEIPIVFVRPPALPASDSEEEANESKQLPFEARLPLPASQEKM